MTNNKMIRNAQKQLARQSKQRVDEVLHDSDTQAQLLDDIEQAGKSDKFKEPPYK